MKVWQAVTGITEHGQITMINRNSNIHEWHTIFVLINIKIS